MHLFWQAVLFRTELKNNIKHMMVCGDDISPMVHVRLNSNAGTIHEQNVELQRVIDEVYIAFAAIVSCSEVFVVLHPAT